MYVYVYTPIASININTYTYIHQQILSTLVGSREAVQRAREWVVSHKHGTVHALKMMRRHAHRMAAAASQVGLVVHSRP